MKFSIFNAEKVLCIKHGQVLVLKVESNHYETSFLMDICNQIDPINLSSLDLDENWTVFHKTEHSSAATTLGHPSRKHQGCFEVNDDEIQRLLKENTPMHKEHQGERSLVYKKTAYNSVCISKYQAQGHARFLGGWTSVFCEQKRHEEIS